MEDPPERPAPSGRTKNVSYQSTGAEGVRCSQHIHRHRHQLAGRGAALLPVRTSTWTVPSGGPNGGAQGNISITDGRGSSWNPQSNWGNGSDWNSNPNWDNRCNDGCGSARFEAAWDWNTVEATPSAGIPRFGTIWVENINRQGSIGSWSMTVVSIRGSTGSLTPREHKQTAPRPVPFGSGRERGLHS